MSSKPFKIGDTKFKMYINPAVWGALFHQTVWEIVLMQWEE